MEGYQQWLFTVWPGHCKYPAFGSSTVERAKLFLSETMQKRLEPHTVHFVFQHEMSKENKLHLQGCIWLNEDHTLEWMKANMGPAHYEPVNDWCAALAYCTKTDTRVPDTNFSCYPGISELREYMKKNGYSFSSVGFWTVKPRPLIRKRKNSKKQKI